MKKIILLFILLLMIQNVSAIARFTITNITDPPDFLRINDTFEYAFTIKNTGDEPAEIRTIFKETGFSIQEGFQTEDQNFLAGQSETYSWTLLTTGCTGKATLSTTFEHIEEDKTDEEIELETNFDRNIGTECEIHGQCIDGYCDDGLCQIQNGAINGLGCDESKDCSSDYCDEIDLHCIDRSILKKGIGEICNSNAVCQSNECENGLCTYLQSETEQFCTSPSECISGFCDNREAPLQGKICRAPLVLLGIDDACTHDIECATNRCRDNFCEVADYGDDNESCDFDTDCFSGFCIQGLCKPQITYCGDNVCDRLNGEDLDTCNLDCNNLVGEVPKVEFSDDNITERIDINDICQFDQIPIGTNQAAVQYRLNLTQERKDKIEELIKNYQDNLISLPTNIQTIIDTANGNYQEALTKFDEENYLRAEPLTQAALSAYSQVQALIPILEIKETLTTTYHQKGIQLKREYKKITTTKNQQTQNYALVNLILENTAYMPLENISIIEEIPKEIAQNASELTFSTQPTILQADPIVQWDLNTLNPGDQIIISYSNAIEVETDIILMYSTPQIETTTNPCEDIICREETLCTIAICDPNTGQCSQEPRKDGRTCGEGQTCSAGECIIQEADTPQKPASGQDYTVEIIEQQDLNSLIQIILLILVITIIPVGYLLSKKRKPKLPIPQKVKTK